MQSRHKRVMMVVPSLEGGGAERVFLTVVSHLANQYPDLEVHCVLLFAIVDYPLPANVVWHHLSQYSGKSTALKNMQQLAILFRLRDLLRQIQPSIAMGFMFRANVPLLLTRWLFDLPTRIIISEHASIVHAHKGLRGRVIRFLQRLLYPHADVVIAVSKSLERQLLRLGLRPEIVRTIYNPIVVEDIRALARSGQCHPGMSQTDAFKFIGVGRLVPQKGFDLLLKAFARIPDRANARLFIVGKGPMRRELEELAQTLGIHDLVVFCGFLENPFASIAAADVFVLSSRFEGFGLALAEAMSLGTVCITTDCECGPREIVGTEYPWLVPVGDESALSNAMATLLGASSADKKNLRSYLCERISSFDISKIGPMYGKLISESGLE